MEITNETINQFARILIMRGMGLYGRERMTRICRDSGIVCHADGRFEHLVENDLEKLTKLMVNYSKFNLPAKMTALVLAKRFGIPIPPELQSPKKRKSKHRRWY
ncbi:MAG: hypothetical protein K9W42_04170 [Candidatus Heimdallarchaeota archaeon]|nr:hypothetical protein [Candidatus Heimdallarchaeota archaeon]